jgi:hypothetical protein
MKLKTENLIGKINNERTQFNTTLHNLSEMQKTSLGSFDNWAPKDFLSHLFSWEVLFLNWYQDLDKAKPQAPSPGYNWDNYYSLNLHIFETNKELTFEYAWEEFEKQAKATLIFADSIDSNDWFEPHPLPWYGKNIPFSEPLWEVTGNHYLWANTEIQKWAKLNI